jgi:hypothetical protein
MRVAINKLRFLSLVVLSVFFSWVVYAQSSIQVKVINQTKTILYIHKGGYAAAQQLAPGKSREYAYPFEFIPPNGKHRLRSTRLVASAGGRWMTTQNGFTFLSQPTLLACFDYHPQQKNKMTRTWLIKSAQQIERNCLVRGYRQLWWQPPG